MFPELLEIPAARRAPPPLPASALRAPGPVPAAARKVSPLLRARQQLRATARRAEVPAAVRPRLVALDCALALGERVAAALEKRGLPGVPAGAGAFGLRDLVDLAYRGLAAGVEDESLGVLGGVGMLLGGPPRAALETALGLLRAGQGERACVRMAEALEGMNDAEGVMSALLAQLWYEAADGRWVAVAQRVLATATDRDARTRCMELLAGRRPA